MKSAFTIIFLFLAYLQAYAQSIKKSDERFIKVKTCQEGKIVNNSTLCFYTSDPLTIENVNIPQTAMFYATVKLSDGRVFLTINNINIGDQVYKTNWKAVGNDYIEGVPVPEAKTYFNVSDGDVFTFKVL